MEESYQDEVDFFRETRAAIIGLGLMGGSLALGLADRFKKLSASDPDPITRELAVQKGIVTQISADPQDILPDADLIILAAPVSAIIELIPHLPDLHSGSPVVIDLGSTKTQICRVFQQLPARFETVGGHPMCGKAVSGLNHAEADLFMGAPFAFTPTSGTTERARAYADQIALTLGATPVWTGPHTHDSWVAATSHLPYLISCALVLSTPEEAVQLVGPGFRSASRLASSPASIMLPILETNRTPVLKAIERFHHQLRILEDAIKSNNNEGLAEQLKLGAEQHARLTSR
jgi:prephenate dehydrogenase